MLNAYSCLQEHQRNGGKKDKEEIPDPGPPARPALPMRMLGQEPPPPQRPLPPPPQGRDHHQAQGHKPATPPQHHPRDHRDHRDHREHRWLWCYSVGRNLGLSLFSQPHINFLYSPSFFLYIQLSFFWRI